MSGVFSAGAEQGTPSMQTGMIGERVTRPRSPLAGTAWADVAPSAASASASATSSDARLASISSQCAVHRRLSCEHMFVTSGATILHADLDAFYASVEQRDDPRLRDRPAIVGAGVVLAASYEAKAHGVRTAMSGARARRLCPHAIVVEPRMSAYAEASKAGYRVFEDTTPLVEGRSEEH